MSSNYYYVVYLIFIIVVSYKNALCQLCPDPSELSPYCTCAELPDIFLDCSNAQNENQLEEVFATANFSETNIQKLTIANNKELKSLTRNVFGEFSFEIIVFQSSAIEYIDEFVFLNSNSTLTEWLVFDCMLISQGFPFNSLSLYSSLVNLQLYAAGKFDLLPKISSNSLHFLSVTNCEVTLLHQQAFINLPNIASIALNDNNITSLPTEMFSGNNLLIFVYFYNNQIEMISAGTFKDLPSLSVLSLEGNLISHIEPGSLLNLPNLITLLLRNNFLPNLLFASLGMLPVLNSLYIQYNKIQFLDQDLLFGSPLVNYVAAGHNELTSIEPGTFNVMKNGFLYLVNNSLTIFSEASLRPVLENGNFVNLYGNPYVCGCDAAWLFSNETLLFSNVVAQCSNGTDIADLDPSYFTNNC